MGYLDWKVNNRREFKTVAPSQIKSSRKKRNAWLVIAWKQWWICEIKIIEKKDINSVTKRSSCRYEKISWLNGCKGVKI